MDIHNKYIRGDKTIKIDYMSGESEIVEHVWQYGPVSGNPNLLFYDTGFVCETDYEEYNRITRYSETINTYIPISIVKRISLIDSDEIRYARMNEDEDNI